VREFQTDCGAGVDVKKDESLLGSAAAGNITDEIHAEYERGVEAERASVLDIITVYTRKYLLEEEAAGRKDGEESGYPPYHLMVVSQEIQGWKP
jgi:hypothetical protein